MRFDPAKMFPYPVLRPYSDDFPHVEFQATPLLNVRDGVLAVKILFELSSKAIQEQIQAGKASFVCTLSSRETYLQKTIKSRLADAEAEFPVSDFRGELRIDAYIVVDEHISAFDPHALNPEFLPGPVEYRTGDILAQDEPQVFYIDRDLFKPLHSVFDLVLDERVGDGQFRLHFDSNHVCICVSQQTKDSIDSARNQSKNRIILVNSIYFAAVMEAVQVLRMAPDDYEGYKWAKVFQHQAMNRGVDLHEGQLSDVASKLMQHPLRQLNTHVFGGSE